MQRDDYLSRHHVGGFVSWIADRLDVPGSLVHSYTMRKTRVQWCCDYLLSAFRAYEWRFGVRDPYSGQWLSGTTFTQSAEALVSIGQHLKDAIAADDHDRALKGCQAVLQWGGIRRGQYITRLGRSLVPVLRRSAEDLSDPGLDLSMLPEIPMNSGWTKIYSLLVDGFSMYDSRVAAALCMMVGMYSIDRDLRAIPTELRLCRLEHMATVDRSPPYLPDQFPIARYASSDHLRSNIMTNWILGESIRLRPSQFSAMEPSGRGLWALQSALFMIGYETSLPLPGPVEKDSPSCTECGSPMVARKGPCGSFFGCSSFPDCRFTASLSR